MTRKSMGNGNPYMRARLSANMTTPDLVRATGLSFSALWNVEQGLIANPNPRIAEVLAEVGIDVTGIEEAYRVWRKVSAKETIRRFANAAAGARG